ncbi:MAG: SoxR reducing system RseC family protein [Sphaerochaetaceae bacterium]|jgi:positive regulator of sigma E activity
MVELASVISIESDGSVTVSCQTQTCQNCSAGAFCGSQGKTFSARNTADGHIGIGDTVELYLPPGKTIMAGFVTLLVPILLFPVGYYITSLFHTSPSEMMRVVYGIGGIALGFLISRLFSKRNEHEYTPVITKIIEQ